MNRHSFVVAHKCAHKPIVTDFSGKCIYKAHSEFNANGFHFRKIHCANSKDFMPILNHYGYVIILSKNENFDGCSPVT